MTLNEFLDWANLFYLVTLIAAELALIVYFVWDIGRMEGWWGRSFFVKRRSRRRG